MEQELETKKLMGIEDKGKLNIVLIAAPLDANQNPKTVEYDCMCLFNYNGNNYLGNCDYETQKTRYERVNDGVGMLYKWFGNSDIREPNQIEADMLLQVHEKPFKEFIKEEALKEQQRRYN